MYGRKDPGKEVGLPPPRARGVRETQERRPEPAATPRMPRDGPPRRATRARRRADPRQQVPFRKQLDCRSVRLIRKTLPGSVRASPESIQFGEVSPKR